MQVKSYILEVTKALFFSFGIQNISMDDIANKCGISKNTIYKHYKNKSDLLNETIKLQVEELIANLKQASANSNNALEELHSFFKYVNGVSLIIAPIYGHEIKKYYPNKYLELFRYKDEIIIPFILRNIEKGIIQGLYKNEINTKEICSSFDNISKIIFTSDFSFDAQTSQNAICFLNSLFMYRVVSIKGLEVLNKLQDN
ncbi:TetR/AcrR family transcriptional regulator [Olleya sp. UBA1516]|uniref:TetR/AcrR family transcriptional regulator n=1 Tax=Olleya sp. UBA1516 TaxID=1947013 RepID=UPI00260056F1|nr:TetR/AcrR family transcriptional regulator [Olleya sp. UBA1516]|tara:strand:- start:53953 stop:54552 length:600 start_codon:yes stop_codon:yes gene_type:complete